MESTTRGGFSIVRGSQRRTGSHSKTSSKTSSVGMQGRSHHLIPASASFSCPSLLLLLPAIHGRQAVLQNGPHQAHSRHSLVLTLILSQPSNPTAGTTAATSQPESAQFHILLTFFLSLFSPRAFLGFFVLFLTVFE